MPETIIQVVVLLILLHLSFISHALANDALMDMDLSLMTEEGLDDKEASLFSMAGYLESRNQLS